MIKNRLKELLAIKARKEDRLINLKTCADETGINYRTVRRWGAQETTRYDADIINSLCEYFKCEPGDLIIRQSEDIESPEYKTPLLATA